MSVSNGVFQACRSTKGLQSGMTVYDGSPIGLGSQIGLRNCNNIFVKLKIEKE